MAGVSTKEVAYLTKLQRARGRSCWPLYVLLGVCVAGVVGGFVMLVHPFVMEIARGLSPEETMVQARRFGFTIGWITGFNTCMVVFLVVACWLGQKRRIASKLIARYEEALSIQSEGVDAEACEEGEISSVDEQKTRREEDRQFQRSKFFELILGTGAALLVVYMVLINGAVFKRELPSAMTAYDDHSEIRFNYAIGWVNGATVGGLAGLAFMVGAIGGGAIANRRGKRIGLLLQYAERLGYIQPSAVPI